MLIRFYYDCFKNLIRFYNDFTVFLTMYFAVCMPFILNIYYTASLSMCLVSPLPVSLELNIGLNGSNNLNHAVNKKV